MVTVFVFKNHVAGPRLTVWSRIFAPSWYITTLLLHGQTQCGLSFALQPRQVPHKNWSTSSVYSVFLLATFSVFGSLFTFSVSVGMERIRKTASWLHVLSRHLVILAIGVVGVSMVGVEGVEDAHCSLQVCESLPLPRIGRSAGNASDSAALVQAHCLF